MNPYLYIISKQIQWARNSGLKLQGSEGDARGAQAYTMTLEENLFEPLELKVKECFENGDGGELNEVNRRLPKMQALHSSSAIVVNVFQYWMKNRQIPAITAACGLCSKTNTSPCDISFEEHFNIFKDNSSPSPNIDVVIQNSDQSRIKVYAIESKFTEAYSSRRHGGLKDKYFQPGMDLLWENLPHVYALAKKIKNSDTEFRHLHSAQLIKHLLGLMNTLGGKNNFRLLYLFYDCPGNEGAKHREEIERFTEITCKDDLYFHFLSYQELIIRLADEYRTEHPEYIEYITGRYL